MTKIAGSGSTSGFINQRHGSADPDPHKNVRIRNTGESISTASNIGCRKFIQISELSINYAPAELVPVPNTQTSSSNYLLDPRLEAGPWIDTRKKDVGNRRSKAK
jgi:hypothetical protein